MIDPPGSVATIAPALAIVLPASVAEIEVAAWAAVQIAGRAASAAVTWEAHVPAVSVAAPVDGAAAAPAQAVAVDRQVWAAHAAVEASAAEVAAVVDLAAVPEAAAVADAAVAAADVDDNRRLSHEKRK